MKNIFNNLNNSFVIGNKLFWKTIKLFFFCYKNNNGTNLKLVEGDDILNDEEKLRRN